MATDVMEPVGQGVDVENEMDVIGQEEYTPFYTDEDGNLRVHIPNLYDYNGVNTLFKATSGHEEYGFTMLRNHLSSLVHQMECAESARLRVSRSLNTVNGIRSTDQQAGDKSKGINRITKSFYNSLTNEGLKIHAKLFKINVATYDLDEKEHKDALIARIIEAHLKMQGEGQDN